MGQIGRRELIARGNWPIFAEASHAAMDFSEISKNPAVNTYCISAFRAARRQA